MEGEHLLMDFLPTSLSTRLVTYEPIMVLPPKRVNYPSLSLDAKVKSVPRTHLMQTNFQPYLRASKQVSVIKHIYDKYRGSQFDMSIEKQMQFLHESPKNNDFKTSRMPEKDQNIRQKDSGKTKMQGKLRRKCENVRFPPIISSYFQKFDMHLSDLSISSTKAKF
jgi:hypothetical protein